MEDTCTVTVSNAPTASALTTSGFDGVAVALLAAGLLIAGLLAVAVTVAAAGRRRGRVVGLLLAGLIAVAALGGMAPQSAQAAQVTDACSLLDITDLRIDQGSTTTALLPGETSPALRFTVNNPAAFDIEVTVATRVINGTSTASGFEARLLTGSTASAVVASGNLDAVPPTVALRIPAGGQLILTYEISVRVDAGNEMQGAIVYFESLVSARQI